MARKESDLGQPVFRWQIQYDSRNDRMSALFVLGYFQTNMVLVYHMKHCTTSSIKSSPGATQRFFAVWISVREAFIA